jgi:hypothetical protein
MTNTNTDPILMWEATAKVNHERSQNWYAVAGVITSTLIALGVLSGSWSFAIVFALIAALYFLVRNERHRTHTIRIYDYGIDFDGKMTPWTQWKHFWILRADNYHELHIAPLGALKQELVIQTGDTDPYTVRDTLAQFIPQIANQNERILDAFIRFCKL